MKHPFVSEVSAPGYGQACCAPEVLPFMPPEPGSRRRRLWDLDSATHCPVLGVCLTIDLLRRLVARTLPAHAGDPDAAGRALRRHRDGMPRCPLTTR
jgi:hypothetical protein